jgi:hypothetical protein
MGKVVNIDDYRKKPEEEPKEPPPETTGEVLANMLQDDKLKAWLKGILKGKEDESDRSS